MSENFFALFFYRIFRDPLSETDSDSFIEQVKKSTNEHQESDTYLDQDPLDQSDHYEEEAEGKKRNLVCFRFTDFQLNLFHLF